MRRTDRVDVGEVLPSTRRLRGHVRPRQSRSGQRLDRLGPDQARVGVTPPARDERVASGAGTQQADPAPGQALARAGGHPDATRPAFHGEPRHLHHVPEPGQVGLPPPGPSDPVEPGHRQPRVGHRQRQVDGVDDEQRAAGTQDRADGCERAQRGRAGAAAGCRGRRRRTPPGRGRGRTRCARAGRRASREPRRRPGSPGPGPCGHRSPPACRPRSRAASPRRPGRGRRRRRPRPLRPAPSRRPRTRRTCRRRGTARPVRSGHGRVGAQRPGVEPAGRDDARGELDRVVPLARRDLLRERHRTASAHRSNSTPRRRPRHPRQPGVPAATAWAGARCRPSRRGGPAGRAKPARRSARRSPGTLCSLTCMASVPRDRAGRPASAGAAARCSRYVTS